MINKAAPKFGMGSANRMNNSFSGRIGENPGPGAYTPREQPVKQKSPNWGIGTGTRPALSKPSYAPGPGAYNLPVAYREGPQYGMREKLSAQRYADGPGPGAYAPDLNQTAKSSPKYQLGTEKRA